MQKCKKYKNTNNTKIQKYKNAKIQKYKNTKIQKYKNTKIQNTKIHIYKHVRIQKPSVRTGIPTQTLLDNIPLLNQLWKNQQLKHLRFHIMDF